MGQLNAFKEDGFIAVPRFCNPAELSSIESALAHFIDDRISQLPAEDVFYEDKSKPESLKQIQRMHEHDDFFGSFMESSPKRFAEELLGEPVVGKNLQYFNKPPGIGQATPAHQDGYYFMLNPCHAVTMWMALDNVDEKNGCVRYLRGSHLDGMRSHERTQTLGFSQAIMDFGKNETREEITCPANPGDLLAHHALTIHRADANLSPTRSRRALGFIFYGENAREDKAAHEAYQKSLADEMSASGRI
jgi:phytanoyl-CoA hydroxylase